MSYIRGQGDCQDEPDGQDWTRDRSKPECSRASWTDWDMHISLIDVIFSLFVLILDF